jgi:MFS family permease
VQSNSTKTLILVIVIFFFTNNLSGSFLPIYFRDLGLSLIEIVALMLFTFLILGFLPIALLKGVKNFERIVTYGILATMIFYSALIFIKTPLILGLAYGVSLATFWPSFNLLMFRLSEKKDRARTLAIYSSIIPSLAGIAGPITGGFIIEKLGFTAIFATSISLYFLAFLLSTRINYQTETAEFTVPRNRTFAIFFATFIIAGLIETNWISYPFFVFDISGTILNMGLVLTATAILVATLTFSIGWISDIKRTRVEFAVIGTLLSAMWCFGLGFASSMSHIVILSFLSGLAGAFRISWSAHFGDSFTRQYYASILVMMETALMTGRSINLVPTYLFVSQTNYSGCFMLFGILTMSLIPFYVAQKRSQNKQSSPD